MGVSHGDVEPIRNRWVWPFADMEVGDWCHVAHELKDPGKVRSYAHVACTRVGKHASVMKEDPDRPGYARIEIMDEPGGRHRSEVQEVLQWGVIQTRCWASYEIDIDRRFTDDPFIHKQFIDAPRTGEKPPREQVVAKLGEAYFGFRFMDHGIGVVQLPPGTTVSDWIANPLELQHMSKLECDRAKALHEQKMGIR